MGSGLSDTTDVFVVDGLTAVTGRQSDGTYTAQVIDLPGCTGSARTREELVEATRSAIKAFLRR